MGETSRNEEYAKKEFNYLTNLSKEEIFDFDKNHEGILRGFLYDSLFFKIMPKEIRARLVKGVVKIGDKASKEFDDNEDDKPDKTMLNNPYYSKEGVRPYARQVQWDYILLKKVSSKDITKLEDFPLNFGIVPIDNVAAIIEIKTGNWQKAQDVQDRTNDLDCRTKKANKLPIPIYFIFFQGVEPTKPLKQNSSWAKADEKLKENTFYLSGIVSKNESKEERQKTFITEYTRLLNKCS